MSIISKIGYSPLKETLGKDALFKLPKYQRGYDWEEGYVGDLIEDINALIERKRLALEQDKEEEITLNHFFGGVILVEIDKTVQKNGYLVERTVYDIVDGQQRITTFVLILHLISKRFKRIAESTDTLIDLKDDIKKEEKSELKDLISSCSEIRKNIVDNYVYWKHQTYHDIREIKLTLARRDQDFFEQLIKEHDPDPVYSSNERLKNAKKKIEKELIDPILEEAESKHEEYEKLSELYNTIVNRCEFVNLITDNEKHANKLFSVINDRGKGLSETNLIRSRMMKIIEDYPNKQETVEKLWDTILLREEDSESFLRDFYTSVVGDSPKINNLHDPFEDDIIKEEYDIDINLDEVINENHAQRVVNLARTLEDEATAYYQIIDGDWPFEESKVDTWYERRLLRLANVLGHKKAFPVLLSAWNTDDQDLFAGTVHLLEIFMFRYIILGNGRPSSLDDSYHPISKELRAKEENANLGQFVNPTLRTPYVGWDT